MVNRENNPLGQRADSAQSEAERRIEKARYQGDTLLDLSGLGLLMVPESVGKLAKLQSLNLSNNALTSLPESLLELTDLKLLLLHGNPGLGLPDELLGPKWTEIVGPAQKEPTPPSKILTHCFGTRARAFYHQEKSLRRPDKVNLFVALMTYFGMVAFVLAAYGLCLAFLSNNPMGMLGTLILFVCVFPVGLMRIMPKAMQALPYLAYSVSFGGYVVLLALFVLKRKRRTFLLLAIILFLVLCLNMIGCEKCLEDAKHIQ